MVYLAKCCNPLPGEEIVGYITRGQGISVHSLDCPNVKNLLFQPEREVEVGWASSGGDVYRVNLTLETEDKPGMLAKLTEAVAKVDTNITRLDADTFGNGLSEITMVVELRDMKHLEKLVRGIRSIQGVKRVDRRRNRAPSLPKEGP